MTYKITNHTFDRAKQIGVTVKRSNKKNKKIDVFRDDKFIASIGDKRYSDFGSLKEGKNGISANLEFAKERQRLYRIRHKKNTGISGNLASKLLW